MKSYDRLYIGGEWVEPSSSSTIDVVSPTTEEIVGRVPEAQNADIDRAVAAAKDAFEHGPWPRMTPAERAAVLSKAAEAIRNDMQGIAELISGEMGSPVSWGLLAQVLAPTMILDYYAGLGSTFQFDTVKDGLLGPVLVAKEPVGVVAAITPWNVPLFLAAAKLAPALLSGSTVVFKPAPETPLDANLFAEILETAGLPKGVLSVVPAGREVGEHLVNHPDINKVSFTGSSLAGKKIGAACGANLKRFSLELGGKSAAILLDDVNLAEALPLMMPNAIMNNGEACISLTRILAPRHRYQEVTEALADQMRNMKVGDALDPATEVGPLVAERQRDRVENYIKIGQDEGAKIALGGGRPDGLDKGWFVEPTLFVDVDNSMRIAQEEIFGPVLSVIPYDSDDDAVSIANDSDYGLCGGVFTADNDRGLGVARRVRTGTYMVNSSTPIDFSSPFGGYKESGMGREFGEDGLELFLEKKTINLPAGYSPSV
ncbi:MAG TPA: aldehyde dehydrogenase [Acidimicrobiales bacterium]|jgi:betaine-aldehyde dehydrogenase|nr:aldehyde dehydrogenase [Acidimicrobiales bacterium]